MAPEYIIHGKFSSKSNIFSFGVMVLEIISGKRNTCSFESHRVDDLLSNVRTLNLVLFLFNAHSILEQYDEGKMGNQYLI